jgi:ComF family protein
MRSLLRDLVDLAVPPICCHCGGSPEPDRALCGRCESGLRPPASGEPPPPALAGCFAAVAYVGDAVEWVRRFKYPRPGISGLDPAALGVAHWLIRVAAEGADGPRPQLLVPVPLHARRLRSRGYNPAALLARSVAHRLRVPVDPTALIRVRDTASQTDLGRRARQRNVRDAFAARRRLRLSGHVWLVDDVVTTGSTVSQAARVLRRAGASSVSALCIARTAGPTEAG